MIANRWRTKFRIFIVISALTAFGFYGYFQAQNLIKGPLVEIERPEEYQNIKDKVVVVQGKTKNVSKINLNGAPIFITPQGDFMEKLPIVGPRTIIEIEVWDRFGRNSKIYRSVTNSDLVFSKDISQKYIESRRNNEPFLETEVNFIPLNKINRLEIHNL